MADQNFERKSAPKATNIKLSEDEINLIEELRGHYGATSNSATIKRALAQAYVFTKQADDDGMVTLVTDGETVKVPTKF